MAGSNAEILARLTLNGEQFSSELAKRLGSVTAAGERAANDLKRPFASAFSEVQKMAQQAIQLPRTEAGSLNLAGEIAGLKDSASAAEQRALALREMATAQLAAADKIGDGAEQLRIEADAARVAARVEDDLAQSLRGRAVAMEAVQAELNQTHSALVLNTGAANDNDAAMRRHANGARNLGQQFGDMAVMIQGGIDPARAFATQAAQMGYAMSEMGGKMGAVGAFLTGPWGIALTIGLTALAPLASKLFETNDALEVQVEKLRKSSAETVLAEAAKRAYRVTTEGVVDALNAEIDATNRLITARRTEAESRNIAARERVAEAQDERERLAAQLVDARFDVARRKKQGSSGEYADEGLIAAERNVQRLEGEIRTLDQRIAAGEQSVQRSRLALAAERAKDVGDAQKAIDIRFDAEVAAVTARRDAAIKAGKVIGDATQREFEDIERRRKSAHDAETKRQQERLKNEREISKARDVPTVKALSAALHDAFPGVKITSTTRTAAENRRVGGAPNSNHLRGTAVDFEPAGGMGSLSKAQIRTALEARGLVINELLGPGDKNHADHFHVSVKAGAAALSEYKARRKDANEADAEALKLAREIEATYRSTVDAFDPIQAAADRYKDTLADLAKLVAAGRIDTGTAILYGQKAKVAFEDRVSQANTDAFRTALPDFSTGIDAWEEAVRSANDSAARRVAEIDDRLARAGDAFERSVAGAADLFGVRVTGPMQLMFGRGGVEGLSADIAADIGTVLRGTGLKLSDDAEKRIASAVSGAAFGQIGGSIFASITGGKNSSIASSLGGVLGNEAGKAVGKVVATEVGGKLGGMLGNLGGPLGSILGGVVGSALGSLFQKAPKGQAGITVNQYGSVAAGTATGTDAQATAGASTLAGAVSAGLNRIAEMLGAKVTGATDVQIGVYKDMLRVNTNGGAIGGVKGSGALTFQTEEAAVAYAIADALKDGVLSGISDASLKILRSGQDLEKALSKALMIEQLPKQLKAAVDPIGAAVDTVREKFAKIVAALEEGGATAEQMANAQQLYNIELEQAKASAPAAAQTLKDFLSQMKVGSNSPLSLRDQSKAAKDALDPYLIAINADKTVDQAKFREAAQSFLDVQRQLFGSTRQYFEAFDTVQAATNKAISKIENASPITTPAVPDPFTKATAAAAEATAKAAQVGNEIGADQTEQLMRNTALLERIALALENVGGADFIGALRGYGQAA